MEYRPLGKSGIEVSTVSLGTWVMGGKQWSGADDAESVAAIHAALDLGVNLIDTAEVYGGGHSEEVVGRALRDRRDRAVVATKLSLWHAEPDQVRGALEGSLRRLQTDYVDLYQIHWPHDTVPFEDTMAVLAALKDEGKVRAIGVSNFDVEQLRRCMKAAQVDSLQPPYSLFWRYIEPEILPFCRENDVAVLAYSPLAQGLLTGKFTRDGKPPEGDIRAKNVLFQGSVFECCLEAVEELSAIAARYGKTPGQTAVNWLLRQPGMTSAILGARSAAQVRENVGAVGWELSEEDARTIDELGRRVMERLGRPETLWGPRWY